MRFLEILLYINRSPKRVGYSVLLYLGDLNREIEYLDCDIWGHFFTLIYSVTVGSVSYKGILHSAVSKSILRTYEPKVYFLNLVLFWN